jgi:homoserine dehydrogenase
VLSDICDIARGRQGPVFGVPAAQLQPALPAMASLPAPYYLRLSLEDRPGALAKVAAVLGEAGISIDRMRQYGHADTAAPVLIVTHKTAPDALAQALAAMARTDVLRSDPVTLRIEEV